MKKFFAKIFHILGFGMAFFFFQNHAFSATPFTDVKSSDPFYNAVEELFDAKIISDDGSHLFRPNDPMNRDFFVALATQIGCDQCMTPTTDAIIKHQESPFVDLSPANPFYYCIASAKEKNIAQGYILDQNGTASCENGKKYDTPPFCAENSITRIEAAAMLLRQGKLWNDSLNDDNFDTSESISDVSKYWYGYAKKAIEIGILKKWNNNEIRPDEKISRGEFAMMAAKILEYTQCNTNTNANSKASFIEILDKDKNPTKNTNFQTGDNFTLIPRIESGNWKYDWTARNENWHTITNSDPEFPGKILPPGKWFIDVKIIDPITGNPISQPNITLTISPKDDDTDGDGMKNFEDKCPEIPGPKENQGCPKTENDDTDGDGMKNFEDKCPEIPGPKENQGCPLPDKNIDVSLIGTPSITHIGNPIAFTPIVTGNFDNPQYDWDFGDGNRGKNPGNQTHTYNKPWIYTVTVRITDPNTGKTGHSTMIVEITNNRDSDGDGILDKDDKCPLIRGSAKNFGCPEVAVHNYGCNVRDAYTGDSNCENSTIDRDNDGTPDFSDQCPDIPGPKNNFGCPRNGDDDTDKDGVKNKDDHCPTIAWPKENFGCPNNDTDGDKIIDNFDKCPTVRGIPEWNGCPQPHIYDRISANICLSEKINSQGLITGAPACNTCPCSNNIKITSTLRDCDIIFPTILSPDKNLIYSRGNFYLLR